MSENTTLIQIIPADGWYAKFNWKKEGFVFNKVIAFGLFKSNEEKENGENMFVSGMVAGESTCATCEYVHEFSNFDSFVYLPECKKNIFKEPPEE